MHNKFTAEWKLIDSMKYYFILCYKNFIFCDKLFSIPLILEHTIWIERLKHFNENLKNKS